MSVWRTGERKFARMVDWAEREALKSNPPDEKWLDDCRAMRRLLKTRRFCRLINIAFWLLVMIGLLMLFVVSVLFFEAVA